MNLSDILSQIIAFDELKTDYKNPVDQCNSLNPVSIRFIIPVQLGNNLHPIMTFKDFLRQIERLSFKF